MLNAITIQGDGVAACCCARLLSNRGLPIDIERAARPNLPSLLVSTSTQNLMTDVFADRSLFAGFPLIRNRTVLWHNQQKALTVAHSGVVAAESVLLERLWAKLETSQLNNVETNVESPQWLVLSSKNSAKGDAQHFGSRMAIASTVNLNAETDTETCWMEALDHGWLFLLPTSGQHGSLISVGDSADSLLGKSRLIAAEVSSIQSSSHGFAAYPRVLDPLCGSGWLACGTNAMGFDPICGEGAGNAIREAILVSAALGALAEGADSGQVLDHYSTRLLGGFLKHLHLCKNFYSSGAERAWWNHELSCLEEGIHWTEQKLVSALQIQSAPRFRLVGFDLQQIN